MMGRELIRIDGSEAMEVMNWKERFLQLPQAVQESLLIDRTAKSQGVGRRRIIWATGAYEVFGKGYKAEEEITIPALMAPCAPVIRPMAEKREEEKKERAKKRAEVFTPSWMCCLQNDLVDEEWFGRSCVFHTAKANGNGWQTVESTIQFPEMPGKTWNRYVDRKVLEITCGEAPYLVSRYDTVTGVAIPVRERIGMLDRKLRIVGENAKTEDEWMHWSRRAFEATYGYEYQGDSLLLARMNLLETYREYKEERWRKEATKEELAVIARILSWNLWQMDGLSGFLPLGEMGRQYYSDSLFGEDLRLYAPGEIESRIHNWRCKETYSFQSLTKQEKGGKAMKFDVIIGNPPYQDEIVGEQKTFLPPIYHVFIEQSYKVGKIVELIHPARFLFNAGSTPKEWNQKMLHDPHLKVMYYQQDSSKIFGGTDIKGG